MAGVFALAFAGGVQAKSLDPLGPYADLGTCSTGDVSGGATRCFGSITGGPTNAASVNVNAGTFVYTDASSTVGLFGIDTWSDIYSSSTAGASFGSVVGTFDVKWDLTGPAAVMLKFGNTWAAYLYNGLGSGTYTFDLSGMGKNALSNYRIVSADPVPVPAALPLLLLGVGSIAFVARRRKGNA